MFSGIVEELSPLLSVQKGDHSVRLTLKRPPSFEDVKPGDSVAVNGLCLTVEKWGEVQGQAAFDFVLGAETLKILDQGFQDQILQNKSFNLERSLRFGDRMHGHFVTGHVDFLAPVTYTQAKGDSWVLRVALPPEWKKAVWKKGSLSLNGVSLTVNRTERDGLQAGEIEVCLIPETQRRTNLIEYRVGEHLNVEIDWMAKGLLQVFEEARQTWAGSIPGGDR